MNILFVLSKCIVIVEINLVDIFWLVVLNIKIKINFFILDVGLLSNLFINFLFFIYFV